MIQNAINENEFVSVHLSRWPCDCFDCHEMCVMQMTDRYISHLEGRQSYIESTDYHSTFLLAFLSINSSFEQLDKPSLER